MKCCVRHPCTRGVWQRCGWRLCGVASTRLLSSAGEGVAGELPQGLDLSRMLMVSAQLLVRVLLRKTQTPCRKGMLRTGCQILLDMQA